MCDGYSHRKYDGHSDSSCVQYEDEDGLGMPWITL
jgi:hypothetical protein